MLTQIYREKLLKYLEDEIINTKKKYFNTSFKNQEYLRGWIDAHKEIMNLTKEFYF
jgi:hypothetical protein